MSGASVYNLGRTHGTRVVLPDRSLRPRDTDPLSPVVWLRISWPRFWWPLQFWRRPQTTARPIETRSISHRSNIFAGFSGYLRIGNRFAVHAAKTVAIGTTTCLVWYCTVLHWIIAAPGRRNA